MSELLLLDCRHFVCCTKTVRIHHCMLSISLSATPYGFKISPLFIVEYETDGKRSYVHYNTRPLRNKGIPEH